ncbi:MAG: M10 family metallopeptidase C-terminal domain-containing protein, partial [Bradyrhizobium sp.]|nr:M10 family metallopeptidase C-terminal domain-containing protein [Bradyrhizobium sp.]
MASVVSVTATNNAEIDGLLGGTKWSGTISYSFPTSPSDYAVGYGSGEADDPGFAPVSAALQSAVQYAIGLISGYTNATIVYAGSGSSDIMVAQSPVANPTAYTYLPDQTYTEGGDSWFGTDFDFSQASFGNYYFMIAFHELGHSFGLKHSNTPDGVANVVVPTAHDDTEYTVMSYRSYVGAADTGILTNEDYGYAQTYMANDILALQTLYGANYSTHSENTVYSWSPTTGQAFVNGVAQLAPGGGMGGTANRIFETIWDGNGIDTYDLSNYATDVTINLNPGASSITSTAQLAYLGDGHYASGNIYNAYLLNNDAKSYIENAIGGSGNDIITGNAIANTLNGGAGNDMLIGGGGNDTIIGGSGTDVAVFSGSHTNYLISYNSPMQTFTVTDQRVGSPDGTETVTGVENFQFADGIVASASLISSNHAPVVTASDFTATHNQNIAASSLFSVTDADSDTITSYQFWDSTADATSGHFVVGGVAQGTNQNINVSAGQLA